MRRLTRDDVIKAVGRADDVTIAEIIGTGATVDELAEAQAWIANDEPLMNAGRPLPSGRVGDLIELLSELESNDEDDVGAVPAVSQVWEQAPQVALGPAGWRGVSSARRRWSRLDGVEEHRKSLFVAVERLPSCELEPV
jgi:hypothetical protein